MKNFKNISIFGLVLFILILPFFAMRIKTNSEKNLRDISKGINLNVDSLKKDSTFYEKK